MADIYFFKFPLVPTLGGAEFHTLKLAKHFAHLGHKVKLVTSDRFLFRLFEKNGLPRLRLFVGWEPTSKWALLLWPLTYFIARKKFKKLVKEIPEGSTFFMQSLTEKLVLTPLIQSTPSYSPPYHGGEKRKMVWLEHKIPGRWFKLNPLLSRYLKLAKQVQVVTVSNFAKQEFVRLGVAEENIQVIYPTPSSSPPISLRETGGEREGVFNIGLLSRLDPEKGVLDFLKTILPYLPNHPDWKILIAGQGSDEKKIKILTQDCKQIQMLGMVNNLDEFFSQISVLVCPSKVPEAFGISALEALARGVPVLASKTGATPELIEHGENGFLVGPLPPSLPHRGGGKEKEFPPLDPDGTIGVDGEGKGGVKNEWVKYLESLEDPALHNKFSRAAFLSAQSFSEDKMFEPFAKICK